MDHDGFLELATLAFEGVADVLVPGENGGVGSWKPTARSEHHEISASVETAEEDVRPRQPQCGRQPQRSDAATDFARRARNVRS